MVGAPEGQRRNNGNGGGNGNNGNGANGSYRHQPNGGYRPRANGNGAGYGNGNGNGGRSGNGSAREANGNGGNTTVSFASARTVFVGITESEDPVEDAHLLREVIALLLEYPGKDRVNLEIYTGGRRVILDLPVVSTGYCDEMRGRLEELLGANSVLLQGSEGPDVDDVPFQA